MEQETKSALRDISKEVHKPFSKKYKRLGVLTAGKNDIWAMDLVDMQEWKDDNKGYRFILTAIDCFTRYAWAVPLKDKSAEEVLTAFKGLVKDNGKPNKIWVDEGKEFYNKKMDAYLSEKGIKRYSTYGDSKASVVERFNRTLKTWMWQEFTAQQTRVWIKMLPDLMKKYSEHVHKTTGMTPKEAWKLKVKDEVKLFEKLYGKMNKEATRKKTKYQLGQSVRISRIKGKFEKGYLPNWSLEIYTIHGIRHGDPVTYYLKDRKGEEIKGSFYEKELIPTKQKDIFLIEKVLKEKKVKGKTKIFVKWLGYSDKYNSWEDKDNSVLV
jgi:hypothetical protein